MKLKDLLKVTATSQEIILRLMHPTDNENFDYEMEFNFICHRNGLKFAPIYLRMDTRNAIVYESERKELTDVLNIFLKMNVKKFYSDIDYGRTEWDDYAPIGDYDISDRIIVELEPISLERFIAFVPKMYSIKCEKLGYVTNFKVYKDYNFIQVETRE